MSVEILQLVAIDDRGTLGTLDVLPWLMNDTEVERAIRRAGYDICWEAAPNGGEPVVYALRDGRRHTRSHATLLALAEYLGRVERPARFVDDSDALDKAIATHAHERNHFLVRRESCRVALFGLHKYVQLVSVGGDAPAMYEVRTDGLRRISKSNLPREVVAAFASRPDPGTRPLSATPR